MKNSLILLDVDEVLADFVARACEVHGVCPQRLKAIQEPGTWDIVAPLSRLKGLDLPMTQSEFWKPITDLGESFWTSIQKTPWCDEVVDLVRSTTDHWYLVTAPSICYTSLSGKHQWVQQHVCSKYGRMIPTPDKYLFSYHPGAVLIDDRESTIIKFSEHGEGVLFPHIGNSLHDRRYDPVTYVRNRLQTICNQ